MEKRVIAVFCTMILLFSGVFYRISYLSGGKDLAQVAKNQSTSVVEVATKRGMIYDCGFRPMVDTQQQYRAAILPCPQSAAALHSLFPAKEQFLERLQSGKPFVVNLNTPLPQSPGVNVFEVPQRYGSHPSAVHIIGHLQDGKGVYGIEQALDDYLTENGGATEVRYTVDATGHALTEEPQIITTGAENHSGVVLTLDSRIQKIVEYTAKKYITKGAVLVMDCATGDIKASVSLPEFDPNHLSASFDAANSPFVNKVFSPFNVGSSFKLAVTAAALENGVTLSGVECTGSTDVGGQIFRCSNHNGHGWVDLKRALEVSCNPYFIELARLVGAEKLRDMSLRLGFGKPAVLAENYRSAPGNVPELDELQNPADMANFGFGQGVLMATPLQVACMVSVFANGGYLAPPRLVAGYADTSGTTLAEQTPPYASNRVISAQTAQTIHDLMVAVVDEGSGRNAKPASGGAGGKTASAQTGSYYDDAKTNEIVEAWFVGFFPAQQPRYTIVVLAQGADSGSLYAAPIFKDVADAILELEKQPELGKNAQTEESFSFAH